MSTGKMIFLYALGTWLVAVGLCLGVYYALQPPIAFYKGSTVYFNCPMGEALSYEVVRSDKGRITSIYDRQQKKIVSGATYVDDTSNCIIAKVEESLLDKQDQNFFEILSFGSNNEELY